VSAFFINLGELRIVRSKTDEITHAVGISVLNLRIFENDGLRPVSTVDPSRLPLFSCVQAKYEKCILE